jgi:hypothetical protein
MQLLTAELRKTLPKLGTTDKPNDPHIARVKFFDPIGSWKWYAMEFDGKDRFFGLVVGFEREMGYFSLSELKSIKLSFGLGIERDLYFTPTPMADLP